MHLYISDHVLVLHEKEFIDRAERHDVSSRVLLTHSHFLLPSFLGGKRKGEKINQSRDQKSCLSARSSLFGNKKYCGLALKI